MSHMNYTPTTVIPLLFKRIAELIPDKASGRIEENEVYKSTRKFLLRLTGRHLFSDVIYGGICAIEEILGNDLRRPLETRSELTLSKLSTLTRLIADLTSAEWDTSTADEHKQSPDIGPDQDLDYLYDGRMKTYGAAPPSLHPTVATAGIELFMRVRSSNRVNQSVQYVLSKDVPAEPYHHEQHRQYFLNQCTDLVSEIDVSCEHVVFFLTAANWEQSYAYAIERVKSLRYPSSEDHDAIPGLDVLRLLYLDYERMMQLAKDMQTLYPLIKRVSHKLVVKHFLQQSILFWAMSRGNEIVFATQTETPLLLEVSTLFDLVLRQADHERKSHTTWAFLSVLMILLPEELEKRAALAASNNSPTDSVGSSSKSLLKPNLSSGSSSGGGSSSSNKKTNFMNSLAKMLRSQNSGDKAIAATSYINLCKAAAAVMPVEPKHALVVYCRTIYRGLLDALYGSSDRGAIYPNLDALQSQFVTSFAYLCLDVMLSDLLPVLTAPTAPVRFQRNIVRGILNLYTLTGGIDILERILQQHAGRIMGMIVLLTTRAHDYEVGHRRPDDTYETMALAMKLGYLIIQTRPELYYHPGTSAESYMPNLRQRFTETIISNTISHNQPLRDTVMSFCFDVLNSEFVWHFEQKDICNKPDHTVYTIYRAIGMNAKQVAENVLHQSLSEGRLITDLGFIKRYLTTRTELASHYRFKEIFGSDLSNLELSETRTAIYQSIETAMLLCICSSNLTISKLALSNIYALTQEVTLLENRESTQDYSNQALPNYAAYNEIVSPSFVVTGSIAVQKRFFKWFQFIDDPSPAMLRAWKLIYDRWIVMRVSALDGSTQKEWRSFSGFLCSLLAPLLNLDGQVQIPDNAHFKARQFLKEFTDMLISDNPFIRESVKEVLAKDASPLIFHHIFRQLSDMIDHSLTINKAVISPMDIRLTGQTTLLITSVIERLYENEVYSSMDIGALALKLLRFLRHVEFDFDLSKLQIRLCQLLELIGLYRDTFNLKHEIRVRNEFVTILAEWLERATNPQNESCDTSVDKSSIKQNNEKDRLLKDKSVAIIKALSETLDGLPIDVPDTIPEVEMFNAKSTIFGNLFSLFLRVLHRCREEEEGQMEGGLLRLGDKIPIVRSQTITSLSRLLNSNVDVGLRFALSLGYHEDLNIRLAFLEVFKNILNQGTRFSAEYNENKRYDELVDILIGNHHNTLMLCDVCPPNEVDEFSIALLSVFDSRHQSLALVKEVVKREIENAESPVDILRRNCVATKLLSLFAKTKGVRYLERTLGPLLKNIIEKPEQYVFEIEPEKLKDFQEFKDNLVNFERCLSELVDNLEREMYSIPSTFREICFTIQAAVTPRFPEARESAISSFFFLRFLCPALVSPEGQGLVDKIPSKEVRRSLLLLAKIIQNMANGSTNPVRLSVVSDRISMIEEKTEVLLKVLRNMCVLDENAALKESDTAMNSPSPAEKTFVMTLHKFLYNHWEDAHHRIMLEQRMRRVAAARAQKNSFVKNTSRRNSQYAACEVQIDASRKLTAIIRALGRPSTSSTKVIMPSGVRGTASQKLYEFMTRNSSRDISSVLDQHVVHQGISNNGTPVLVLTGRNYHSQKVDTELVLYYFFQVASKMWSDEFIMFYDCTAYSPENAVPLLAHAASASMVPDEMVRNCTTLCFYNIGSEYLPRLKKVIGHFQNGIYLNPSRTKYIFLTVENIRDYFNPDTLRLDSRSIKPITDATVSFPNVNHILPNQNYGFRVTIKVGHEYVQLHGEQPFEYLPNTPGYTNDVIHLSDIRDVVANSSINTPEEFDMELMNGKRFVFSSPKRLDIIRAIQKSKSRLLDEKVDDTALNQKLRVEDSLPTLLNMCLANLCAKESSLQQAAYNLLATIPSRFDIDFGRELRGGPSLAIPKNEVTMAVAFSEAVAISHPEMTDQFLMEFFSSYNSLSKECRQESILYAVPWIKNIYQHVYLADEENGLEDAQRLIRNCLSATIGNVLDYNCLLMNVWPILCLEEDFTEILLDEVLACIVDRGLDDAYIEDALSVITSFPTVNVCGTVLAKIRKLLMKPLPVTERSLVNHPNWVELVSLVKMTSYLSFESVIIAEMYLPEVFLLITTFLYTGEYAFRSSLHSLLINIVHSFSCSPKLSHERKEHVGDIWRDLCSAKGKLLFGLSDEMKTTNYDYFVLAAVKHIESCCTMLLDILATVGTVEEGNVWRARWSSFVMNACFVECPALQCRSFLVLGCLARLDVEDVVVSQVLKVLKWSMTSDTLTLTEEYASCTLFCLTKMVDGLSVNSKYHAKLFWLALSVLRTSSLTLFSYAIDLFQACVKSLDDYGTFKTISIAEYFMRGRKFMEGEWQSMDEITNIKFSIEFFDVAVCATVLKGLEKSLTRASTLRALETMLEISAKNNVKDRMAKKRYPSYLAYLYFLYLGCRSHTDLKDMLWVAGYPEDHMDSDPDSDIFPTLLREYLADESAPDTTIVLFLGGQLFRTCNEYENIDFRFLESLRCVGEKNTQKKVMVYSMVRDKVLRIVEQGSNSKIMDAVLTVGSGIVANVELFEKLHIYRRKLQALLIASGFEGALLDGNALSGSFGTRATSAKLANRDRFVALVDKVLEK
ncbi:hypothetical protein TRVA0_014S01464 [Trichomonascus vanleenenianus]|uniref:Ras GTPase activating protein IRA2 n=1 Tax=Trichomonascus vanleenenianus TaxID=2268995 RepID=UPI003ECA1852